MLKVLIDKDVDKVRQQIKALEHQLIRDTNEKDKQIHQQAISDLKNSLKR